MAAVARFKKIVSMRFTFVFGKFPIFFLLNTVTLFQNLRIEKKPFDDPPEVDNTARYPECFANEADLI